MQGDTNFRLSARGRVGLCQQLHPAEHGHERCKRAAFEEFAAVEVKRLGIHLLHERFDPVNSLPKMVAGQLLVKSGLTGCKQWLKEKGAVRAAVPWA